MTRAFRQINEDGTGKISFANLKKILTDIGESLTDKEIQEMITEIDSDGDGQVSFDVFMRAMVKAKSL